MKKRVSEKELAEAHVRELQTAVDGLNNEVNAAILRAEQAAARYESCSNAEAADAKEALRVADEKAKALQKLREDPDHKRNVKQLALAQAHLAAVTTAETRARYDGKKPGLAGFADEIAALAARFVELDRTAERLAAAVAEATSAHVALYAEAKALAIDLAIPLAELGDVPDRVEVALLIRKSIAAARTADGAEHRQSVVEHYLHGHAPDWRTADMRASDVLEVERLAERNRAIERDRERQQAFAAGVQAGRQTPPAPPAPPPPAAPPAPPATENAQ